MVLFAITVHVIPSGELSHCTTLPTLPVKVNVPLAPAQEDAEGRVPATVVGLTVIVNVMGVPVQVVPPLVYEGVTVIVAITGAPVIFVAVNAAISPVPLAASPIDVAVFVQF